MAFNLKQKSGDSVIYLYGVTKGRPEPAPHASGVDGHAPLESIKCGDLTCWISRVPRADFADDLAKNMENLDWLADMSVRHQRAVSAIAQLIDILPARFGTVFLNEASLSADLQSRKAALEADFKRIQGSDEYGVKVFVLKPPKVELPVTARTGKDYLQAKSTLLRMRTRPEGPDEEIERFAEALENLAEATAEGGKISRGRRDLQYQVSLLLKRSKRKKLESLVKSFSDHWGEARKIECTGPWPPYSFVSRSIP
jgi:gas vesicle protein GvpL/GvpF